MLEDDLKKLIPVTTILLNILLLCIIISGCSLKNDGKIAENKENNSTLEKTAKDYVITANRYFKAGFPLDAADELQKAMELSPDSREITLRLCNIKWMSESPEDSLELIENALKIFPDDKKLILMAIKAYMATGSDLLAEKLINDSGLEEDSEASELLSRINLKRQAAIKAAAVEFIETAKNAERLMKQSRYSAAAESFEKAEALYRQDFSSIKDAPERASLLYSAAQCYQKARMTNEALLALKNTIRVEPEHIDARRMLAEVYAIRGRPELSVKEMKDILALNPDSVDDTAKLAVYLHRAGDFPNAAFHLKALIEKDPRNPVLLYNLALALRSSGDFPAAREACTLAIRYSPVGSQTGREAEKLMTILRRK